MKKTTKEKTMEERVRKTLQASFRLLKVPPRPKNGIADHLFCPHCKRVMAVTMTAGKTFPSA